MALKVVKVKDGENKERDLSKHDAKRIIQNAVNDSSKVLFTKHGKERKTRITSDDVMRVLRNGFIEETPFFDNAKGTWLCSVIGSSSGRKLKVVAVIQLMDPETQSYLIIVTSFEVN